MLKVIALGCLARMHSIVDEHLREVMDLTAGCQAEEQIGVLAALTERLIPSASPPVTPGAHHRNARNHGANEKEGLECRGRLLGGHFAKPPRCGDIAGPRPISWLDSEECAVPSYVRVPRIDSAYFRMLIQVKDCALEHFREEYVIGIKEEKIGRGGQSRASVSGETYSTVVSEGEESNPRFTSGKALHNGRRAVRASIVDHNEFPVLQRLEA